MKHLKELNSFMNEKVDIDEAVSSERIATHAQKLEKLKKEADTAMKKYEKLMGSKNDDAIDEAYADMIEALEKFMDHKKTAP
jgi:Zn-dependent oligopeptidase